MKFVIFGLSISSSWGNGHATLWRGLCRALRDRGHTIAFFERDVPYYAPHRDLTQLDYGKLVLYPAWSAVRRQAEEELRQADVAIVTSFCFDAIDATELVLSSPVTLRVFYDLDTPVTLSRHRDGTGVPYIGPAGLQGFDLTLSYTGGPALRVLQDQLGACRVAPLYNHVDPAVHHPAEPNDAFRCELSYLGTYSEDRQQRLESLFIEPAHRLPNTRFVIGGAQYPQQFPWAPNIYFVQHLAPAAHPAFFASCRLTLNVTRHAMAEMGYCPPGRLFEAAACGAPLISDSWAGIEEFFTPGAEIIVARDPSDVVDALQSPDEELRRIAAAARERVLAEHTAANRALELERVLESCAAGALHAGAVTS